MNERKSDLDLSLSPSFLHRSLTGLGGSGDGLRGRDGRARGERGPAARGNGNGRGLGQRRNDCDRRAERGRGTASCIVFLIFFVKRW